MSSGHSSQESSYGARRDALQLTLSSAHGSALLTRTLWGICKSARKVEYDEGEWGVPGLCDWSIQTHSCTSGLNCIISRMTALRMHKLRLDVNEDELQLKVG